MFLGLDLGTSGLRGLLVDENGQVLSAADAAYDVTHPHPGWSEQDPADWISALGSVCTQLAQSRPQGLAALQGLAIAGQMHGATLLDAEGQVLRRCMLWNDTRSHAQAAAMDAKPIFRERTGNIVFPGFTAPKVQWVAENEPEIFARIAKILLPKDYLRYWLTGVYASDLSDSAGTAWLDVGARNWSDNLLAACNLDRDQMPGLVEGSAPTAVVAPRIARQLGFPDNVMVAGGGGDNAAAACGIGALSDGQGFVSLGTSGVLLAAKDGFAPEPASAVHSFCHAIPDRWYQMGVILAATDSLNWLARILGQSPAALTGALGAELRAPGRLRFLPYLSGERTPHNDSWIRGGFLNIDIASGTQDLTRAVLEGVSFAFRDNLEALKTTGTHPERLMAIGGGARSAHWLEMMATVLNLPLDVPARGEFGAAMGAARLAICGSTGAAPAEVMTPPPIDHTISPQAERVPAFEAAWHAYRETYPALKDLT